MAVMARPAAGAVAAFAALAAVASRAEAGGLLTRADQAAYEKVRVSRSQPGVVAAHLVSALAEPAVIYPLTGLAGLAAAGQARWRRAGTACLVVACGAAARRRLSRLIARPRPPAAAWLITPEGFSLPSKHTALAALAAGACVRSLGRNRGPARAAPLLAAAAVGGSRVYLGVHWPADVIAGWLFAEGWLRLAGPVAGLERDTHGPAPRR